MTMTNREINVQLGNYHAAIHGDNRPQALFADLPEPIQEKWNETDPRQDRLTPIEAEFRESVEAFIYERDEDGAAPSGSTEREPSPAAMRANCIEYLTNLLTCMREGHQWHVDSQCGRDSASEDFTCTRCGYSPDTIVYF